MLKFVSATASAAVVAILSLAGVSAAWAQAANNLPASVAALIPAAKKDAELTIFGQALNPGQTQAMSQAISAYYGFPIKLNMVVGLHVSKVAEVVAAVQSGVPSGLDVFWTTAENISRLSKGDALMAFDWTKELNLDPALKFSAYGLKSHDGMLSNVLYNTGMVKADEAPKSFAALLDPKWKGRIAMPRSPGPWVNLSYALGDEPTAKILTSLMNEQEAKLLPTYPDVKSRVISGEFPIGIGPDVLVEEASGAPVANADLDVAAFAPWAFTIMKDARHVALAKLWGYWAVSDQGQQILDRKRGLALVSSKGTLVWKYAQDKKAMIATYDYSVDNSERLSNRYGQIMGIVR